MLTVSVLAIAVAVWVGACAAGSRDGAPAAPPSVFVSPLSQPATASAFVSPLSQPAPWEVVYDPTSTSHHRYPEMRRLEKGDPLRAIVDRMTKCDQEEQAPATIYDVRKGPFSAPYADEEALLINKNCRPDSQEGEDMGQDMVSHLLIRNATGTVAAARLSKVAGYIAATFGWGDEGNARAAIALAGGRSGGKGFQQWAQVVLVEGTEVKTVLEVDPTIEYEYRALGHVDEGNTWVIEGRRVQGKPEFRARRRTEVDQLAAPIGTPAMGMPPSPLAKPLAPTPPPRVPSPPPPPPSPAP